MKYEIEWINNRDDTNFWIYGLRLENCLMKEELG